MTKYISYLLVIILLIACSEEEDIIISDTVMSPEFQIGTEIIQLRSIPNPDRNAYFGDLHVHTENSFDAYSFGTINSPTDAYRYARGQAIPHPTGFQIQLSRPLDFYAVTDHACFWACLRRQLTQALNFLVMT